jgi:hypothetical protein
MAIKLDTSSPTSPKASSFDPLPGVSSLAAGEQQMFNQIAQTAGNVSNMLHKQEQSAQQMLINKARYSAMGQMEADYNNTIDAIQNNKESAKELEADFRNKYKSINLNSYLGDDNVNKITMMDLAQNSVGELNYRYGSFDNKLKRLKNNLVITNGKIDYVRNTGDTFNKFWADNPVLTNSSELEFKSLIAEKFDPNSETNQLLFSSSDNATQKAAFTNPQKGHLKLNIQNYLADSPNIDILNEREEYARQVYNEYGADYGLNVAELDTTTFRANIRKLQKELSQARISELLAPLDGSFTAIGNNPGYQDFAANVERVAEVTQDIDPSLLKYASEKQLEKIGKIDKYVMLLTPPTDEEGNVVGIAPMQEILMHSTLSDDKNYSINQLAQFGFTKEQLEEINGFVNTVRTNISEAEKQNRTDYYRYIFPQYANHIDNKNWADAQLFYEQNVLRKEVVDEKTGDVTFYGLLKKLPKFVGDFRPLFDIPEKGMYDETTVSNYVTQLSVANEGNTNFPAAIQYIINGEGGYPLSAQQVVVAELAANVKDPNLIDVLAPKLVSIENNYPNVSTAQIEEVRKAMTDNAEDDYNFRFFKDKSNVIQDLHYAVEDTTNAKNTSKYTFYNTMLNNLIAQGITDNRSIEQIQMDVSNFTDNFITPTFGRYAVFEHDDRNMEIQVHPDALRLMDDEMPRGNYYRGFNELGKNVFNEKFSTRAADDVHESLYSAVFAFAFAFNDLDSKGMYEAMGVDPLGESAFPDQTKSRDGMTAFINGAVKNTYVPDQFKDWLGNPIEGYEGRTISKVRRDGDFYIPMYYDMSSLKYTEFADRNGDLVKVPVDRVHSAVRSYNIEKNKFSQIQVVDVLGPWKKKTGFFTDYFAPGLKAFVPDFTTGL